MKLCFEWRPDCKEEQWLADQLNAALLSKGQVGLIVLDRVENLVGGATRMDWPSVRNLDCTVKLDKNHPTQKRWIEFTDEANDDN